MFRTATPTFHLSDDIDIRDYAKEYNNYHKLHSEIDLTLENEFLSIKKPLIKLDLEFLRKIAHWKSPRSSGHIEKNEPEYVQAVTSFVFQTKNERARIEALTILSGVQWPMASVILHFFHEDPYPILDYHALNCFGVDQPNQYDFSFWWSYVEACRNLSARYSVDMRTLDKALWMYDKKKKGRKEA